MLLPTQADLTESLPLFPLRGRDTDLTRADTGATSLHCPLLAWPSGPTGRSAEWRQRWLRGRRGSGAQAGGCQATATRIRPISCTEWLDEHRFQPNVGALFLAEPCFCSGQQGQEGFQTTNSLCCSERPPWRSMTIVWILKCPLLPSTSALGRGDYGSRADAVAQSWEQRQDGLTPCIPPSPLVGHRGFCWTQNDTRCRCLSAWTSLSWPTQSRD